MQITINALSAGAYSFGNGSTNYFEYADADGTIFNVAGILHITSATSNDISGDFSCQFGAIPLSGTFTGIPVEN